jgi:hypothetical protein
MTRAPAARWNAHGLLCIQLESINAFTNAHKLALDGVGTDGVRSHCRFSK